MVQKNKVITEVGSIPTLVGLSLKDLRLFYHHNWKGDNGRRILDYNKMVDYVEKKYDFDIHDCANADRTYNQIRQKYNVTVTEELKISINTNYYSHAYNLFEKWLEDNTLPSSKKRDIPELDYWHYLLNYFGENLSSDGCVRYFPIKPILHSARDDWVKEVTQHFYDEFQRALDHKGGVEVYIWW